MDAEDKPKAEIVDNDVIETVPTESLSPTPPDQSLTENDEHSSEESAEIEQTIDTVSTPVIEQANTDIPAPIPNADVSAKDTKSPKDVSESPDPKPLINHPISDDSVADNTSPKSSSEATTTGPQLSNIKPQLSAADRVATLTLEELRLASQLYTKKMQKEYSQKAVAKRKRTMELNLREIVDYLSIDNGAPLPRIAKHTNITPGTTSKYLRQLIARGKVRAEGWGKTRRYFLS